MAFVGDPTTALNDSVDPMQQELLRRQSTQSGAQTANGAAFTPSTVAPTFVQPGGGPQPATVIPPNTIVPSTNNSPGSGTSTTTAPGAAFTPNAPGSNVAPTGATTTPALSQNSTNTATGVRMVDAPTATTFLQNRASQLGKTLSPADLTYIAGQYGLSSSAPVNMDVVNQIAAALPTILARGAQPQPERQGGSGLPNTNTSDLGPQGIGGSPRANSLFDLLMARATQGENVSPSDAIIQGEVAAYRNRQTKSGRDYLRNLAEKAGPNANIGAETRQVAEAGGQATGAFEAQLLAQERAARRGEIEQALSGAAGLLTNEQQMALQQELAQMNLQENAYQFDTTNSRVTNLGY